MNEVWNFGTLPRYLSEGIVGHGGIEVLERFLKKREEETGRP